MKRLYKSRNDKVLDGVCAGMADYLGMDPTLMRIIWVLLTIFASAFVGGIVIYVICSLVIPREPHLRDKKKLMNKSDKQTEQGSQAAAASTAHESTAEVVDAEVIEGSDQANEGNTEVDAAVQHDNPVEPAASGEDMEGMDSDAEPQDTTEHSHQQPSEKPSNAFSKSSKDKDTTSGAVVAGIILIAIGAAFLLGNLFDFSFRAILQDFRYSIRDIQSMIRSSIRGIQDYFFPMLLIGIGLLILVKRK